jgi:hypothetical protein
MRSEQANAIVEMARRTRNVAETRSVIAAGVEAMVSVAGSGAAVCVPDLGVALGVGLGAAQAELSMVLWSMVTAPLRARAWPCSVTPVAWPHPARPVGSR